MEEGSSDSDDPEYRNAFAALADLRRSSLKQFFKENCLRDEVLLLMQSEGELKNILIKELNLPFGDGFAFSRLWFQKYHNNKEETPFEGLPNPGLKKYDEPSKGNQKQGNEPSQIFTPPNGGHGRYRPEGNQIPTDSAKGETKICLEENNAKKWKATVTPMTSPGGTDAQSEKANALSVVDNNDSFSITEQNRKRQLVGLKESSSTEDQVIYSSSPFVNDQKGWRDNNVSIDCEVEEMSTKNKSVNSKVKETDSGYVVYNDDGKNNHGERAAVACYKESAIYAKSFATEETVKESENQPTDTISNLKGRIKEQKEASKGASSTPTSTKTKDSKGGNIADDICFEGLESRTTQVGTVENDIGLAETFPQMHDESVLAKLHLADVICLEDGVGKGVSNEAPMGTKPAFGVQCEIVKEPDEDQSFQMSHQNFVNESYSMMEISAIGDQTATSRVSDKQGPKTSSVLINREVQEMSPGDKCVSSVVTEPVSVCVVCNNNAKDNHEKEALSVCSEEKGRTATERALTSKTLEENVDEPKKPTDIEKPKGVKNTEKKGSKGASGTLTTTNAKDSEGSQEVDENLCLKGQVLMTLSPPGRTDEIKMVEDEIGKDAMFSPMHEQSVLVNLHQAEVVCLEDGVGGGKAEVPTVTTKNGYDVQCERANEMDTTGDLQMSHRNQIKKSNSMMETSSTENQAATSIVESISDKEGPKTTKVLVDCEVQEMSLKDESVTSDVMKMGSVCEVYNDENNNNHEKEALSVCFEESGTPAKEKATNVTLDENERNQPTNTSKSRKKKQKKASKATNSTLTTTKVVDSKSQNVDDDTSFEGQESMGTSSPGKPDKVSTVVKDISEAAILPQMREQSLHQLHQAEVVCVEQDGADEGKAIELPMATKIEYDVQCETVNESDAAGGLVMYHQNHVHVKEINAVEENSSTGGQTRPTSSVGDKQDPKTSNVLVDSEVKEMSLKDESVTPDVMKVGSVCEVYNDENNNNHEKETLSVCFEESGTTAKEKATNVTLDENENQPTNTSKARKKKQKKASKATSSTLTTTKVEDSKSQKVDDDTSLEGQASMTIISTPGKPDEVSTVENNIGEAAILPQMREQSVDQLHQAEVVCVEQDGAGEGKVIEPPLATKIEYDVQCETVNESDAAGGLHMYHQNHVLVEEINAVEENSSTGDQTATSSVGDEQGARPRTGSALIEGVVREMSSKNESVSSEVTESVPIAVEDGAFAGIDVKERETETLKENESQSTNTIPVPKGKRKKKKQKKGSKGASSTLTTTNAKDTGGPQNVDEHTCFEGQASLSLTRPEGEVDVDINKVRTPPELSEHSVTPNVNHAEVVTTDPDIPVIPKMASEKKVEDCIGGSTQEEPAKTELPHEPSSLVKSERVLVKEVQTVIQKEAKVANLNKRSTKAKICSPRARGVAGRDIFYEKGSVFDAEENRELEFKSLVSALPCSLPWKIMEKAKKFICGCLNADRKGIIYFGVGDNQEQDSKYRHGEILGLEIEDIKDDINKAFQSVLDDHIKSDAGPLQKGGEQNCVSLHFVPVKCQGNLKNLYVVEIEVSRDWRFCKENIYYSKTWAEKRVGKDCAGKKALSDLFKVKDEYDDVAVRTNGATSSVKQIEVDRQVKKPLEVKYKEWRKQFSKHGAHELPEEVSFDDADAKRLSLLLRERLRELNHKEYGYILIANKLPAKYRGTANLSFLQNIPWLAVFDLFDPGSKKDGLHYACNETTDAPRATIRTLDDFKDFSTDKDLSIRETTWILGNEEMQTGDWIKCSKDCLYRALSAYKQCYLPGHLVCVFLCLSETSVHEMADIMESSFSILGTSANSCVTIISEAKNVANAFIKASKFSLQKDLHECTITDISWSLLKEIVREMVGPSNFEERGTAIKLPYFNGGLKEVLNKIVNSWNDLEVYSPNPRLPSFAEHIEKERNAFYKGSQASQVNLFHNHSIPRSLEKEIHNKVERALKYLSKENGDVSCQVKTITFPYEPGSGATTLCRRILWNKRTDYRCAVVKAITSLTDFQIERLQSIGYDERNLNFSLPVLVLVDNFPENDVRQLTERIMKRETKCVVLTTFPIEKSATNSSFEITPLRKLDENETRLVKDILINITSDAERRKEAEQVLEREKRFIWFGLELFGRDYLKIEERLQNHIQSILTAFLGDSKRIHKKVLDMCCFLSKYSDGCAILPHAVLQEFIQHTLFSTQRQSSAVQDVHEIFGGLLLEEHDETNGYPGWRPAHYLVSEVVTSGLSVEDTAVHFLEKVCKCQPYVVKFLRRQVFKVFLDRKRISDPIFPEEQGSDDNPDGSDFDDVFGSYEVRTRYSPLIVDILNKGNIPGALRVLIAICGEAKQPENKAYAWQQLARFMGYEMLENEMNESEELHESLFRAMAANKGQADSFQAPKCGIEAAHIAVDIAINHHPNYGHHYATKGDLYRLQLRQLEERHNLPGSLHKVIEICRKALDVYDKALKTSHGFNHYPMIGKIQAILSLLKFVKNLPCFDPEDESFTNFLEMEKIPWEMEDFLSQDEHDYVKSLSSTTLDVLNELFENVKFKQTTTYDENEIRSLTNAKIRASKLRRAFYKITGFDRRQLNDGESQMVLSPSTQEEPAHYQHVVEDILFIHDETPYSAWSSIPDRDVESIYNHLKPVCLRGHGSHNDMLICCKACLQLKERPPVTELDEIVTKWVANFPNSVWAHLFNYMVHFPIPNRSLAPYNSSTKASIKKCVSIVTEKAGTGFRKSGTEYFLGKGIGLDAILSSQEFRWLENRWKTKTHFWRSKETTEKLERVQGQKDVNFKGVITYQGIQLNFDNTLYPNESKDDLWFYVGFSVAGPYAYDPVDNDTYAQIRQQAEDNASTTATNPSGGVSISASKVASVPGHVSRSKPRMSVNVSKQFALPTTNTKPPDVSQTARRPSSKTSVSRAPSAGLSNSYCDELSNFDAPQQSTTGHFLYSSALQDCTGSAKPSVPMAPKAQPNWKTVTGTRGYEKKTFLPKHLSTDGKLHHGAFVLGLKKSKECPYHNPECKLPKTDTNLCNFAHGWRGDTKQIVCTKCTDKNLHFCKEKITHEEFFWDLGPYFNATGTVWKGSRDSKFP